MADGWPHLPEDSTVRLWRLPAATSVQIIDEGMAGVSRVAFSPDSSAIAWGEVDGTLRLRTTSGVWLQALNGRSTAVTSLAFSPDGGQIVAGFSDGFIRAWESSEGALLQTIYGHTGAVSDLAFSADGHWLVSASIDTSLRLWKFDGGSFTPLPVRIFMGHTGPVTAVDFSPWSR
jgi:WD40 repeat protein